MESRSRLPIQQRLGGLRWPVLSPLGVHPAGDERSRGRGPGVEYADVREYSPGDDPRQIDWNLSARSGRTYIREAHPDRGIDVWLLLDASRSLDWGTSLCLKREAAADLVAAALMLLARRGNRVGAVVFDRGLRRVVGPSSGRPARARLLAELLRAPEPGESGSTDLAGALEQTARLIRRPSLLIVVSDFMAPAGWQRPLRALALTHEVLAAVVSDPREDEIPDVGLVTFEDPETGVQLDVDTADGRLRERFRAVAVAWRRELKADLVAARAEVLELSTGADVLVQLRAHFARARASRRLASVAAR